VIVWDVASNSLITRYDTPGCNAYGLLRTPDNAFLVVGCVLNGLVEVLNPATGTLIETLNVGGRPRELSYDASSCSILAPNEGGWVDILR
jgi:DNA-binding beta-propeller fold protein YncE